jgi:hypothetical protein
VTEHVAAHADRYETHAICWSTERKGRRHVRPGHRQACNIKSYIRETVWDVMCWIGLAKDTVLWLSSEEHTTQLAFGFHESWEFLDELGE